MLLASRPLSPVKPQHSTEHGNVLFLILIAVALFAALSYAITNSNRVGGSATETEMAAAFDAIQNAIAAHRAGLQRMALNGVEAGQLEASSGNIGGSTPYTLTNSLCTSDACRVYRPSGGAVPYFTLRQWPQLAEGGTPLASGFSGLYWTNWARQGSDAPNNKSELVLKLRVTESFCSFYNKRLGLGTVTTSGLYTIAVHNVSGSSSYPLSSATNGFTDLDAAFSSNSYNTGISGAQAGNLNYQDQGCSRQTAGLQTYDLMALVWVR